MTEHHRTGHNKTLQVLLTPIADRKDETMATISTWRPGARYKADAQKCADEIMEICDDIGSASPRDILEKARDDETELHKCFTWDDGVAAERYRLVEAGQIVRLLVVKHTEDESKPEPKPIVFQRIFYKTTDNEGYKPVVQIMRKKDEYEAMLARAYSELQSFKNKYQMLSELETVFEAIDALG